MNPPTTATQSKLDEDAFIAPDCHEKNEATEPDAALAMRTFRMHAKAVPKESTRSDGQKTLLLRQVQLADVFAR